MEKLQHCTVSELNERLSNTDKAISAAKKAGSPEDGPQLAALRKRRSDLVGELHLRQEANATT